MVIYAGCHYSYMYVDGDVVRYEMVCPACNSAQHKNRFDGTYDISSLPDPYILENFKLTVTIPNHDDPTTEVKCIGATEKIEMYITVFKNTATYGIKIMVGKEPSPNVLEWEDVGGSP